VEAAVVGRRAGKEAKFKFRSAGKVDMAGPAFVAPPSYGYPAEIVASPATVAQVIADPDFSRGEVAYSSLDQTNADPQIVHYPGFSQAVMPSGETTWAPLATPQMIADQATADARRAIAAITAPSEVIKTNSPPVVAPTGRQVAASDIKPGVTPSEINPETGRKKRACSVCRQAGHTAKNCPQNPDSDKYQATPLHPLDTDGQNPVEQNNGQDASAQLQAQVDVATLPYCEESHGGGWTNNGTDWVCPAHGKISRAVWETRRVQPTPGVIDPLHDGILQQKTQQGVLDFRARWLDTPNWSAELETHAQHRWTELATAPFGN
jgi:hypothetical protein